MTVVVIRMVSKYVGVFLLCHPSVSTPSLVVLLLLTNNGLLFFILPAVDEINLKEIGLSHTQFHVVSRRGRR